MVAPARGIPVLGPSGASAHLRGVAWAFHRAGHALRLVAAAASDARGAHGEAPVPIEAAPGPGWPSWLGRWRERQERLHSRRLAALAAAGPPPDIIYERWSLFADVGRRLRRPDAPWVLEVNAPLARERARFEVLYDPPFAARMERRTLRAADHLVAVSPWLVRWLVDEVGVAPERVHLVPNGVEPLAGDREGARRALGVEGRFVVGFLGSIKPRHGAAALGEEPCPPEGGRVALRRASFGEFEGRGPSICLEVEVGAK